MDLVGQATKCALEKQTYANYLTFLLKAVIQHVVKLT